MTGKKMKYVWFHIYRNSNKSENLLDKQFDTWYTKLWRRVKDYLKM